MKYWDWTDWAMHGLGVLIALIAACGVLVLFVAITDGVFAYRAEPASIACQAQRGVPLRRTFSTTVTCGLAPTRQDAVTVLPR